MLASQPSEEGSEVASAVPSPVPQSEEEVHEAAPSDESKSPQRRRRKKWSFKRTKSQEEGAEGELTCDDMSLHE